MRIWEHSAELNSEKDTAHYSSRIHSQLTEST